jgi:lysophospholipase L1-like esterase
MLCAPRFLSFYALFFLIAASLNGNSVTGRPPKRPPSPQVTPRRAAALRKVDQWLKGSTGALEQPEALARFFGRLYRTGAAEPSSGAVHILQFGDSHTAADWWTADLRNLFQHRFGNGGSGFSVAGRPFKGYRRVDAPSGASLLWQSEGLHAAEGEGYFGLGGVSISTDHPGQFVSLDADCNRIEISYLRHPGGGSVELYDHDQPLRQFSTDGEIAPSFVTFEAAPGPHRFVLKTLDSHPVRLFGWVADKPTGVTYEALGINGAEASIILRWNESMLTADMHRRDPGLIVLAYGTNDATDSQWTPETYREMFSSVIRRLHSAAPGASILVISPGDRWTREHTGWRVVPGIDWIIDAQRQSCRENGCAFWDLRRRTGGKGVMEDWFTAGLAQPDHAHFTFEGYKRLASALFDDLMSQFESSKARLEAKQSHGPTEQNR